MGVYDSSVLGSKGVGQKLHLPIYFMEVQVAIMKNERWSKVDTWIVSVITDKNEILKQDAKTRSRLNEKYYGSKFKGKRGIRIEKIYSCIQIGTTSW